MLERTFYKEAKCSKEQSVPRSRVFQDAKCVGEQSVSGSKVCQGAKCSEKQSVCQSVDSIIVALQLFDSLRVVISLISYF